MMGSRFYLLIALAVSCHGLPKTAEDDVVPERQTMLLQHRAAFTKLSPTAFISAMTSSGGSEEDCRTFADKAIKDIEATITTTQEEMNIVATGSSCAAMGQDQVQAETAKVAAAKTAVQNAETDAASKNTAKEAAASATYQVTFDLTSTQAPTCLDVTGQSSYLTVKALADSAKSAADTADTALADAKTAVTAAEAAHTNAVDEASRLKSACLCRAHKEQKAAMAAASTATASHEADWKQAHELICALDKTTTCTVPTCPTVTQQTLAAGVANADTEHCLPEGVAGVWDSGSQRTRDGYQFKLITLDYYQPSSNSEGNYLTKCKQVGFKMAGCGTSSHNSAPYSSGIAMPPSWGCNMLATLKQHATGPNANTYNSLALQEYPGSAQGTYTDGPHGSSQPTSNQVYNYVCACKCGVNDCANLC